MQEFQENPRSWPGAQSSAQQKSAPRTRAQQAADNALAAADLAIGIGSASVDFARSIVRRGRPLLDSVMSPLTAAAQTAAPLADRTWQAGPQPWLRQTAARGRQDREALTAAVFRLILTRVPGVADAVHDVRMQSISADERLSRAVDAMLLRRRARRTAAPEASHEPSPGAARPASP